MIADARHLLEVDGDPWDGGWYCTRCHQSFAYAVDGYGYCHLAPWGRSRVAAFQTRVARLRSGR